LKSFVEKKEMSEKSPTKEELPKLANPLKTELIGEHHLKHADTQEKVVLPSAEEIESEKSQQKLFKSIEEFEKTERLSKTETNEKNVLPTLDQIQAEKDK